MLSIIKLRILRLRDDFWVYLIMMIMAFGLTFVFGMSFNEYRPAVLIIDEDKSVYSEAFISEIKNNNELNFINADMDNAVKEVEAGKVLAALLIDDSFDIDIKSGDKVSLGVMKIKDDTMILTLQKQISGVALKMVGAVRISDITADYITSEKPNANRESVSALAYQGVLEAWKYKNPIEVIGEQAEASSNSNYDSLKHSMIGFSLFFSMYTMVFGIGTILNDKQYKTWQRMLISPVSKSSILGGSMAVAYFMGAIQMGILVFAGKYLLGIDWGSSMLGIMLVVGAFVFAVTSLGLMLSGVVKTHAQLAAITPVVLTSTSMLGGCMWPLEIVNNKILLLLAEITPQKWAIQGMEGIASKGLGLEAAILPTIVLLIMGSVFFGAGVKLVRFE